MLVRINRHARSRTLAARWLGERRQSRSTEPDLVHAGNLLVERITPIVMGERIPLHRSPLPVALRALTRAVPPFLLIRRDLAFRRDLVASLLVQSGFCRIRFWYLVASGSGISRETGRIYFWNLTVVAGGCCDFSEVFATNQNLSRSSVCWRVRHCRCCTDFGKRSCVVLF
jgi:hypothetical protein